MTEEREPNKPLIREWVEALRSGKYLQGRKSLRTGDKFCCLGVACDVAAKEGWVKGEWKGFQFWTGDIFDAAYLSKPLQELYGLSYCCDLGTTSGALMNDEGSTFAQIAGAFEEEYLKCHA